MMNYKDVWQTIFYIHGYLSPLDSPAYELIPLDLPAFLLLRT